MEAAAAQFDMKKLQGCATAAATTGVGDSGFKRICVFCGSSSGNKTVYLEVARELGTELVSTHAL
jgi:predicted Rossmann-fold nucleotide-binding protein